MLGRFSAWVSHCHLLLVTAAAATVPLLAPSHKNGGQVSS
jgi:hypothetical protein